MTNQLTVRQIADLITRPHEQSGTVIDRIRGWADFGLLKVDGDKHPGTGKKRLYDPGTILDAAMLTALTDAGLAAVRVGHFVSDDGMNVLELARKGALAVLPPSDPVEAGTYVVIAGLPLEAGTMPIAYLYQGSSAYADNDPSREVRSPWNVATPAKALWSMAFNLSEIFLPFRGTLTATENGDEIVISMNSEA